MTLVSPSRDPPLADRGSLLGRWSSRLLLAVIAASTLTVAAYAGPAQDYMLYCMGCHGAHAEGVPGTVPLFTPEEVTGSRHSPLASVLTARREVIRELATTGPAPSTNY